jgi:hypothetical protein
VTAGAIGGGAYWLARKSPRSPGITRRLTNEVSAIAVEDEPNAVVREYLTLELARGAMVVIHRTIELTDRDFDLRGGRAGCARP